MDSFSQRLMQQVMTHLTHLSLYRQLSHFRGRLFIPSKCKRLILCDLGFV